MATKKKEPDNGYLHIKREPIKVDWKSIFKLYNKHYTIVTDGLTERRRECGD